MKIAVAAIIAINSIINKIVINSLYINSSYIVN